MGVDNCLAFEMSLFETKLHWKLIYWKSHYHAVRSSWPNSEHSKWTTKVQIKTHKQIRNPWINMHIEKNREKMNIEMNSLSISLNFYAFFVIHSSLNYFYGLFKHWTERQKSGIHRKFYFIIFSFASFYLVQISHSTIFFFSDISIIQTVLFVYFLMDLNWM